MSVVCLMCLVARSHVWFVHANSRGFVRGNSCCADAHGTSCARVHVHRGDPQTQTSKRCSRIGVGCPAVDTVQGEQPSHRNK